TRLRVLHTPGHAPDHLCFFDAQTRDMYCGDLVRMGGSIVIPASKGGNLRQYLDSLQRVRMLAPARLLPGHGPVINDPDTVIDEYARHCAQREVAAISAPRASPQDPDPILSRSYAELSTMLTAAAA